MNLPSPSLFLAPRRVVTALLVLLSTCIWIAAVHAEEPAKATGPTPEQEAKFVATLTNATLKGRGCGVKEGVLGPDKEESYHIVSVAKVGGDKWVINARFNYGGKDVDLPIPALVKWAGDTPMLILDNVSMGTPNTYSARVMIYENTYSGWWTGPNHRGLLGGVIINARN